MDPAEPDKALPPGGIRSRRYSSGTTSFLPPPSSIRPNGGRSTGFVPPLFLDQRVLAGRSKFPSFVSAMNPAHPAREKLSKTPVGSFESRMWTAADPPATSTQAPSLQKLECRHINRSRCLDIGNPPAQGRPPTTIGETTAGWNASSNGSRDAPYAEIVRILPCAPSGQTSGRRGRAEPAVTARSRFTWHAPAAAPITRS